jgi:magnesium transporter
MNFDNMPELHWHAGYAAALALMAVCVVALVAFFRRIGWL